MAKRTASRGTRLQDALLLLGARRVESALLAALHEHGALGTQEIVALTGLRQPEVSVGMQELRHRGWVEASDIPREGKGRPMHRYTLAADLNSVRKFYEARGMKSIEQTQDAVETLRRALN